MAHNFEVFEKSSGVRSVTLCLHGEFTFKEGCAIWEVCRPEQTRHQVYYFDLGGTTRLHDNGLAWLRLFLRWAHQVGRSVRFINASAELREQLAAAGMSVTGTARDGWAGPDSEHASATAAQNFFAPAGAHTGRTEAPAA